MVQYDVVFFQPCLLTSGQFAGEFGICCKAGVNILKETNMRFLVKKHFFCPTFNKSGPLAPGCVPPGVPLCAAAPAPRPVCAPPPGPARGSRVWRPRHQGHLRGRGQPLLLQWMPQCLSTRCLQTIM